MSGVLVDSSVILDVLSDDPTWADWSEKTLLYYSKKMTFLYINPIIYAEISIGFKRIEELESTITAGAFRLIDIPKEALFLAGKAFLKYRRQQGTKLSPLPDFFIGAHAAISRMPLITRDHARIKTYFPTVKLVVP